MSVPHFGCTFGLECTFIRECTSNRLSTTAFLSTQSINFLSNIFGGKYIVLYEDRIMFLGLFFT